MDVARVADMRAEPAPRFRLLETMRSYARHSDWMDGASRQRALPARSLTAGTALPNG